MSDKKVWLVTGAGRGLGVDIAKAALAAGHAVVATGRNPERVSAPIGESGNLLAIKLDVTNPTDGEAAAAATVDRFGPDRFAGQQRRQLQRRLLRGAEP
jgi:NAD(P)-dependent dehydrogenase (short-subunit alcohol dehydrogenase family)